MHFARVHSCRSAGPVRRVFGFQSDEFVKASSLEKSIVFKAQTFTDNTYADNTLNNVVEEYTVNPVILSQTNVVLKNSNDDSDDE